MERDVSQSISIITERAQSHGRPTANKIETMSDDNPAYDKVKVQIEGDDQTEIIEKSQAVALDQTTVAPTTDQVDPSSEKKMSKKQLKRQRKYEEMQEKKRRRKEREKAIKLEKAKAEGRDLDAERKADQERTKDGSGWAKRHNKWVGRLKNSSNKFKICLDCSFEEQMHSKEINSLASQLRYCYAANRRADHPVEMTVTSLGGDTLAKIKNVAGFDSWNSWGFHHTEKDFIETFPDKTKLVYLTSDSTTTLEKLEDDKVYIIGGIVDRNRLKKATINRAEKLGVATAKLPIDEYIAMTATKVLTCNHVFDILLQNRAQNEDWKATFLSVLPARKDVNVKDGEDEAKGEKVD